MEARRRSLQDPAGVKREGERDISVVLEHGAILKPRCSVEVDAETGRRSPDLKTLGKLLLFLDSSHLIKKGSYLKLLGQKLTLKLNSFGKENRLCSACMYIECCVGELHVRVRVCGLPLNIVGSGHHRLSLV